MKRAEIEEHEYRLKLATKEKEYELAPSAQNITETDDSPLLLQRQIETGRVILENHSEDYLPSLIRPQTEVLRNLENETEEKVELNIEATSEEPIHSEELEDVPNPPPTPTPPPPPQNQAHKVDPRRRLLTQDILMVENQIPFVMLQEIDNALQTSSGNSSNSAERFSPSIFRSFCVIHSPLELCSQLLAPSSVDHLLQYLYYSILNNIPVEECGAEFSRESTHIRDKVEQAFNFMIKLPQKEIGQVYEQTISILETFTQTTTLIPSASNLHNKSGFSFISLPQDQGIQKIRIQGKDIYLPSVSLKNDSEVILRNLVAYETLITKSNDLTLTEYVAFMCALIVNVEDVKYLKKQNVIKGELGDDEVAKLFIGLSTSLPTIKKKEKSNFRE